MVLMELYQIMCRFPSCPRSFTSDAIRLLDPANGVFDDFVRLLHESQGHLLCEFSDAVFSPLQALLQGRLEEEGLFPLERVDRDQILALPKGSPDLLRLIRC